MVAVGRRETRDTILIFGYIFIFIFFFVLLDDVMSCLIFSSFSLCLDNIYHNLLFLVGCQFS